MTDDVSGESTDASEVRAARKEVTEFMNENCWRSTGKSPVSTKRIDSK